MNIFSLIENNMNLLTKFMNAQNAKKDVYHQEVLNFIRQEERSVVDKKILLQK